MKVIPVSFSMEGATIWRNDSDMTKFVRQSNRRKEETPISIAAESYNDSGQREFYCSFCNLRLSRLVD
jgi:hypothetical protein